MNVFEGIVIPYLGGQDQRYQGESFPIRKVHEQSRFGEEPLDVNEAEDWDLLLHSSRNDYVFAEVVELLQRWVALVLGLAADQLVRVEIVILVEYPHLESEQLLEASL